MTRMMLPLVTCILLLCCSCYRSSSTTGSDVSQDAAPDPALDETHDVISDEAEPEAADDVPPDVVHDVVHDVPPAGIDFIVRNLSGPAVGMIFYFTVWPYTGGDPEYPFDVTFLSGVDRMISFYVPWCTVPCDEVDDPMECCIDCMPPFADAVLPLSEEGSFLLHWDGTVYEMNHEICECGCYEEHPAEAGPYHVSICAYHAVECYEEPCMPGEDGLIWGARGVGAQECIGHTVSVPDDYGSTYYFDFVP